MPPALFPAQMTLLRPWTTSIAVTVPPSETSVVLTAVQVVPKVALLQIQIRFVPATRRIAFPGSITIGAIHSRVSPDQGPEMLVAKPLVTR